MNEKVNEVTKKNPYTVWFVVLSFVAPVILAYLVFFFGSVSSFTNKGEILNPIVDISALKLKDETNSLIPKKTLTYKWRLISFVGSDCDTACNSRLYDVRQIHKSLGKDQHRVLRMIVHLQAPSDDLNKLIESEYPNALNFYGDEKTITAALGETSKIKENEIYIMDPMGNIMMRFTQEQPNRDFQKDLRKLLKASQIG
ncbi:MAG: cytochrome c oxidase subunit I [Gammaproteobacteria bacterium]|nr:MAG: cytochrome c oxidase subunit I [Gammaproteobacteria bacterium]